MNGDTLCVVTIDQVRYLNYTFEGLRFYQQLSDTFRLNIIKLDNIVGKQNDLLATYASDIAIKESMAKVDNIVIGNLKDIDKANARKIKWLSVQRNVLAVLAITLGSVVYFHH